MTNKATKRIAGMIREFADDVEAGKYDSISYDISRTLDDNNNPTGDMSISFVGWKHKNNEGEN